MCQPDRFRVHILESRDLYADLALKKHRPHNRINLVLLVYWCASVKTTIEIPDPLFREVKARAALQNVRIKDLIAQLLKRWLAESDTLKESDKESAEQRMRETEVWLKELQAVGRNIHEDAVDSRTLIEILRADRNR